LVVYVWVDAPIGYISFTEELCKLVGCDWEEIWKNGEISDIVHFIGLDIVYHHCIFWPAMLKGADYSLPKAVVASGMVKIEGKTFSKSRGYVVWVEDDYLKRGFHPDYLRYYIVSYTSHEKDLNFSWKVFRDKVNNELIGTFGNFIYRVLHFAWKNFGEIRMSVDSEILERIKEVKEKIEKAIKSWEFKEVCDAFMELATFGNEYFQAKKPWELVKKDREECEKVLANAIQLVKALTIFAYPVMPKTMEKVAKAMNLDLSRVNLDSVLDVDEVVKLNKPEIPFVKVEDKKIEEMEKILMERIERAERGGELIDIKDFARLDIRIGRIVKAEKIKGSKKLLRLEVDVGGEVRQIVAGIAETYSPEELMGKLVPVLVNIKPAKLMGVESKGMILDVDVNGKAVLLQPEKDVPVGSKVR
jgi:methionyl-tRNA synthetase